MTDVSNIANLDLEAWDRWVSYRKAIRKPLKDVSMHAAALKLSKYGADQAEVVNQSVSNQWQGLFDLQKKKTDPAEPKQKTDKQKAADQQIFEANCDRSARFWQSEIDDPIMKLRLCDALLSRYLINQNEPEIAERIVDLKGRVGEFVRLSDPKKVLGDPHVRSMVFWFFGERGIKRLQAM